ncbi:MAG: hypothetical protein EBY21_00680 [Alphaproteobacteria bacterium]|nr:hypothetical protein [Alphaproteobacteria bacterium]
MSKKKYPGFDEQALQSIARNFPSTAPIDPAHFSPKLDAQPAEAPQPASTHIVEVSDGLGAQTAPAPEPAKAAPHEPLTSPPPRPVFTQDVNVPANDLAPLHPSPAHNFAERPTKTARMSKFPIIVSLLALAVASAPLLAPRLTPIAENYNAPQWVRLGIEILGGKQSLPTLRAEALFAQERSQNAAAEAALSANIEDAKSRLLRLETSGSDLTATAARLDRLDEAVTLARTAQLRAEEVTREFASTLKNSEDGLRAAAARSEDRFLSIETAAREAMQGQLTLGQDIATLRQGLTKQNEASAGLAEAITNLETKTTADRSELAAIAALAAQNVAALKLARDDMQGKVDLLNEQLAKFGDALEAAVAMEIARSSASISEAIERATLADERARGLEAKLSTYQDNQIRGSRITNVVNRLGAALLTSEPFTAEVAEAKTIFTGVADASAPLDALASIAPTGALAQSKLRENFLGTIAPQLRDLGVRYDASLWSRAYTMIAGQDGPTTPEGQRVWEVVSAAEKFLAQGDLANALIQIARFEGPANQIVADWLTQARRRAAADKAYGQFMTIASGLQTP